MARDRTTDEPEVLRIVIDALKKVDEEGRERIVRYVSDLFSLEASNGQRLAPIETRAAIHIPATSRDLSFGDRASISPKDFLHEKQPKTDIERVACLAYYLTHYRDTPHFNTIDISKLNTESAQVKFSNPAAAVSNATSAHLITAMGNLVASAGKGNKQISAIGERFVDALPNRDDAKAVLATMRPKRRRKKSAHTKKARKATG